MSVASVLAVGGRISGGGGRGEDEGRDAPLPTACAASVWKYTPLYFLTMAPISLMGWIVPISLLTIMTETRHVSGRMLASRSSRSTTPFVWTGR